MPRGVDRGECIFLGRCRQLAKRSYGTTFKSVGGSADPLRLGTYSQRVTRPTWPVLSNSLCTGTIQSWWPMRTRISNACYRKHVALVTKERPRKGRRAEEATSSLRRRPLKQGGYGTTQPRVNNPDRPISSWKKYIPQRWNPTDVVECVPQASKMPFELHGLAAAHSALSNCTRIQFKAGISWYSTGNACCNKHAVAS